MADYTLQNGKGTTVTIDDGETEASVDIKTDYREIQQDFIFPSTFADGLDVGDDLCENVIKYIFNWDLANAVLISASLIVTLDDSGGTQSTINVKIGPNTSDEVYAFSSAVSISETRQTATIDTANDTVNTDDRVKVVLVGTGTEQDAENLHLRLLWRVDE